MGVLIVLGTIGLAVGIAVKMRDDAGFTSSRLGLPTGAEIEGMTGVGDRLAVLARLPGGERRVILVDPRRGRVVGTLEP